MNKYSDEVKNATSGGSRKIRGPLHGITVLDLSWHLAGPFCTLTLADMGARVIKVEAPNAHGGYDPSGFARHRFGDEDAHYMALNRNKQSIVLDLKSKEGRAAFESLVAKADVVFNNFRAGVMRRLQLDYESLRKINPSIICASLSAFGQDGPYESRPGVDLVIQALSGCMSMTGEIGRGPVRAGIPLGDLGGGMWAAISIISAVRARERGLSEGMDLDVSLLDGLVSMLPYMAAYHFLDGYIPGPQGSGGHAPTYRAFKCADGRYVVIAVSDQKYWERLSKAINDAQIMDSRFATPQSRQAHRQALESILEEVFLRFTSDEWCNRLTNADVAHSRVNRLDEALSDPQVMHRGMIIPIRHRSGTIHRFVATPTRFPEFDMEHTPAPLIGGDTDAVLREFGLSPEAIKVILKQKEVNHAKQ